MAHAAPPPPGHRRRNSIIGAAIVVLGVIAAVFAFIGLSNPKGTDAGGTTSRTQTVTRSATPSSSGSSSTPITTKPTATKPTTTRPTTTRPPTTRPTTTRPTSASTIPLIVLNNTSRTDLAATARTRFQANGWTVTSIANYQNTEIISTCAYWDATVPGAEAAAEKLQQQFPNILRVKQRFDELPSGPVVVVLNDDYS